MQIFAFGDSITWGSEDEGGGWADRLKRSLLVYGEGVSDSWYAVYNLGIPGESVEGLAKRFTAETENRSGNKNVPKVFLFGYGANDCAYFPSKGRFRVPIDEFERNYKYAIQKAKELSRRIFLLSVTPVEEPKNNDAEKIRKNEFVKQYNAAIKNLAESEDVELIDIHAAFVMDTSVKLLSDDGLHPNSAGHEMIYSLVKEALGHKLGIKDW